MFQSIVSGSASLSLTVRRLDGLLLREDYLAMSLDYPVILKKSEEGYAVGCPALPGCWSQGATRAEALDNIRDAIRDYLEAEISPEDGAEIQEIEVAG